MCHDITHSDKQKSFDDLYLLWKYRKLSGKSDTIYPESRKPRDSCYIIFLRSTPDFMINMELK